MGDTTIDDHVDLGIPDLDGGTLIGSGASARVYRSRQRAVDRPVAVKILGTRDPELVRRFRREARALGRLSRQPGIVSIYDYGETESGQPYLVLELCDRSLRDRIVADGSLDEAESCGAALEVAKALAAAHEANVVHRDIKPGNILIDRRGRHLISDFGISTLTDTSSSQTDHVGFTAGYAAPEVFDDVEAPGVEADVYALGATVVNMLTGRPPFYARPDEGLLSVISRISGEPAPDLTEHGVSEELNDLLGRMLAKSPVERPSIDQLIGELEVIVEAFVAETPSTDSPEEAETVVGAKPGPPDAAAAKSTTDSAKEPALPVGNRGWGVSMRALAMIAPVLAIVATATWWFALRDKEPSTLEHGADAAAAADAEQPSDGGAEAQRGDGQGGGADSGANDSSDGNETGAGADSDDPSDSGETGTGADTADAAADGEPDNGADSDNDPAGDDADGTSTETPPPTVTNGRTITTATEGSTPTTISTTTGAGGSTTTTSPSTTAEETTTSSTAPETTVSSTLTSITPPSSPTTSEGALVITGIDGPREVPCGVGARTYTAITNGVEVTSWAWNSPLRTLSPIGDGPSLRVEFVNALPGQYRITVRANDGEASGLIDVTVEEGVNCAAGLR